MRSGSLRTLVTFEQRVITRDPDSNEEITTWATYAQAWAEVEAKTAQEFFDGVQRLAQTVYRCRFRPAEVAGVNETMRMAVDGVGTLSIKGGILRDATGRGKTEINGVAGAGND